jgi:hypothetical protein
MDTPETMPSTFRQPERTPRSAIRHWGTATLLALLAGGCFRPDIVTTRVDLPQMRSAPCAERAGRALAPFEPEALREATFDVAARQVVITYDRRRLALKNIEYALTRAGFDANQATATEAARASLPPECR